jgi:hypothetical protein
MSCPFCHVFACYERQINGRLETDTFAMSDASALVLVHMASQIRKVAQVTMRHVGNEAVPMMLCDLLDGLAEGLVEGLSCKLEDAAQGNGHAGASDTRQPIPAKQRD